MEKQLEETQKQLAKQMEKTLYEENQKISREEMDQLRIGITTVKDEKRETNEVLT